jgi:hypothetical protein
MTENIRVKADKKKGINRAVKGCLKGCLISAILVLAAFIILINFLFKGSDEANQIMTQLVPGIPMGEVENITTPFIENGGWRKESDIRQFLDDSNLPDISEHDRYSAICRFVHRDYGIYIYLVSDQEKQHLKKAVRVDHGDSGNLWIEDIKGDDPQLRHQTFLGFENGAKVKTGGYCEYRH